MIRSKRLWPGTSVLRWIKLICALHTILFLEWEFGTIPRDCNWGLVVFVPIRIEKGLQQIPWYYTTQYATQGACPPIADAAFKPTAEAAETWVVWVHSWEVSNCLSKCFMYWWSVKASFDREIFKAITVSRDRFNVPWSGLRFSVTIRFLHPPLTNLLSLFLAPTAWEPYLWNGRLALESSHVWAEGATGTITLSICIVFFPHGGLWDLTVFFPHFNLHHHARWWIFTTYWGFQDCP